MEEDDGQQLLPFDHLRVAPHRVEILAHVMAGFRWPGRRSFDRLTKEQQRLALDVARQALERLAAADD